MRSNIFTAAVVLIQACSGLPLEARNLDPRHEEPCKQVRDNVAKWMTDNGIVPKNLTSLEKMFLPSVPAAPVRPSVAFACLKSIGLYRDAALQQLELLRPVFEWQSTLDYLRDPPRGYLSEAVDLLRGLDDIAAKLRSEKGRNSYANEFEYLADVYTLTSIRVRDAHLSYQPLLMDLFTFRMGVQFISISEDGLSPPKVYVYDDVKHTQHGYTPSPVSTIDGVPALDFLQKVSLGHGWAHDPDARFNMLFPSVASNANLGLTGIDSFVLHLEDTTKVKHQNGTSHEFDNTAFVRANFTDISSGTDVYRHFGQGNATTPQPMGWSWHEWAANNFTANFAGYPERLASTWQGNVAGFLPDTPDLSDVAVLGVNSFAGAVNPSDPPAGSDPMGYIAFNNVTLETLRAAKAAGRSKLIIDLQGNGGGYMTNLASLYWALFPSDTVPLLWQGRAHPQLEWLGNQLWNTTTPPSLPMGFHRIIRPNNTAWTSFSEFYGPIKKHNATFTHAGIENATLDFDFFYPDYQPPTWSSPPFAPSDILLLTDGQCASACAIFTSLLVHNHGVRTLALGGRPLRAPMQAVGMTKGGPVLSMATLPDSVNRSHVPEDVVLPPPSDFKPPLRVQTPGTPRAGWGDMMSVNMANTIPVGEKEGEEGVPLQMRYEAANCRVFFTWEMARDITAVWRAAADLAWRGGRCVPGSTTGRGGRMGKVPPGYSEEVEDRWRLGPGPGAI